MKDTLVRFGVAMEASLLASLDEIVADRGGTRSELLRDLARAEVTRARVLEPVRAVATLTLVYDHHVRDLTERLTEFQHALGERVRSTLHIHLDHDNCLEVIVLEGRSDEIKRAADKLLATRGVKHGGVEIIADENIGAPPGPAHPHPHAGRGHDHGQILTPHKARPARPRSRTRR
jgi:CopG family nickel-responsive transcriptional regulator